MRAFLDTNILVYMLSDDPIKSRISRELFLSPNTIVSMHILFELPAVLLRKFSLDEMKVEEIVRRIANSKEVVVPDIDELWLALRIRKRHGFSFWDSLHLATALGSGCRIFYTEDMQHGRRIGGLEIINPFRGRR